MVQVTIAQLAERFGVARESAYGFVRFMIEKGLVTKVGTTQTQGKGRGADIFSVEPEATAKALTEMFLGLQTAPTTGTEGEGR